MGPPDACCGTNPLEERSRFQFHCNANTFAATRRLNDSTTQLLLEPVTLFQVEEVQTRLCTQPHIFLANLKIWPQKKQKSFGIKSLPTKLLFYDQSRKDKTTSHRSADLT
ncbi:uncharacterized protein Dyak_GE27609 [Drosophila yakuba]|uniref:Uncharacterized protein n=1 Tax=Drosophila yakuba TaxID=7245 RepID=A0A0R1E9H7_DROYA|nr:uncharacterized protein Dyak_GE27609 [Drosophila yakuba]